MMTTTLKNTVTIQLDSKQKSELTQTLQKYLQDELDVELGQFDTEFLVDFISKKFGAVYYNKGIEDAQKVMERKMLDISDELYEIEQIVEI
ncbi:hypothetical protein VSWAT3_02746 [Vibrionales bacterium SWAT-3]|nr:hypothetical protein VSWAT3_02746 [Vibrionales bacterium SWAT-3]